VARQSTPQETIAALAPLTQKLDDLHGQIGAVLEHLTKAQQLTSAILQGGQPAPMLARLNAVRQTLLTVVQRKNQAKQNVNLALVEARKAGDQGN